MEFFFFLLRSCMKVSARAICNFLLLRLRYLIFSGVTVSNHIVNLLAGRFSSSISLDFSCWKCCLAYVDYSVTFIIPCIHWICFHLFSFSVFFCESLLFGFLCQRLLFFITRIDFDHLMHMWCAQCTVHILILYQFEFWCLCVVQVTFYVVIFSLSLASCFD